MANINRVMSNNILTLHLKIIHLTSSVWSKITGSAQWDYYYVVPFGN